MGFLRQEYWSDLPFPSPGESSRLRDWICIFCTADGFFTSEPPGKPFLQFTSSHFDFFLDIQFLSQTLWCSQPVMLTARVALIRKVCLGSQHVQKSTFLGLLPFWAPILLTSRWWFCESQTLPWRIMSTNTLQPMVCVLAIYHELLCSDCLQSKGPN